MMDAAGQIAAQKAEEGVRSVGTQTRSGSGGGGGGDSSSCGRKERKAKNQYRFRK
jgi:hypothetical protein